MPKLLGLHFTNFGESLIILIQVICYSNTFYTLVFLLGPRPFPVIFLITLIFSRSILAFYQANCTHKQTSASGESSSYCKSCKCSIENRDHHCVFIGRCVQKANYKYFLSYVFYSYLLSAALITSLVLDYNLIKQIFILKVYKFIPFFSVAILSSIYFVIFTGGLLSGCFRSIILGVYTVEELKKKKAIKYTNSQLRALWFSSRGREIIKRQMKKNWTTMVGQVSWKQIIFVI